MTQMPPRPEDHKPPTGSWPTGSGQPGPAYGAPQHPFGAPIAPPPAPPRRSRGLVAGVLLAALVVGGGAGVGGAALYDAAQGDGTTASSGATTSQQVSSRPEPTAPDGSTEAVAAKVLPSVVEIEIATPQGAASGSGVVLTSDGRILTNNHVVEAAAEGGQIRVSFADGTTADADIVGADPVTDSAVIQAKDVSGLTPIELGTSADLQVGQAVVAIGSPYGLSSTVTEGIVSALDRPVNVGQDGSGSSITYPAIQTDAAINPGNSGGALVDMNGSLVGINSSIRTTGNSMSGEQSGSIGLGFAIPIDELLPIVDQIVAGDEPTHARLGVTVGDAAAQQEQGRLRPGQEQPGQEQGDLPAAGAALGEITPGSGADSGGLESGDIITKVDDHVIKDADTLVAIIRTYRPDDTVKITYLRDGEEKTADVQLQSDAE